MPTHMTRRRTRPKRNRGRPACRAGRKAKKQNDDTADAIPRPRRRGATETRVMSQSSLLARTSAGTNKRGRGRGPRHYIYRLGRPGMASASPSPRAGSCLAVGLDPPLSCRLPLPPSSPCSAASALASTKGPRCWPPTSTTTTTTTATTADGDSKTVHAMPSSRPSWFARHCAPPPPLGTASACPCAACFNVPRSSLAAGAPPSRRRSVGGEQGACTTSTTTTTHVEWVAK